MLNLFRTNPNSHHPKKFAFYANSFSYLAALKLKLFLKYASEGITNPKWNKTKVAG